MGGGAWIGRKLRSDSYQWQRSMDQGVRDFTSRAKSEFGVTLPSAMEGGVKHAKKSLSDRKDDIHKNCMI